MTRTPTFFHCRDHIVGPAFTAVVLCAGRILAVQEEGRDVWIHGVEAGALAAHGVDLKEALEAFRETFTKTLNDLAMDAGAFDDFRRRVLELFSRIDSSTEDDWQFAADSERIAWPRRPDELCDPVERVRFVQVFEEREPNSDRHFEVTGASIGASPTA